MYGIAITYGVFSLLLLQYFDLVIFGLGNIRPNQINLDTRKPGTININRNTIDIGKIIDSVHNLVRILWLG